MLHDKSKQLHYVCSFLACSSDFSSIFFFQWSFFFSSFSSCLLSSFDLFGLLCNALYAAFASLYFCSALLTLSTLAFLPVLPPPFLPCPPDAASAGFSCSEGCVFSC